MTIKISTTIRNARLDQIETTIGTNAKLWIYSGAMPSSVTTAASGTKLVSIQCPSDWMAAASAGSKAKSGTWSATATGTGTAGYWRLLNSGGTTVGMQGTVSTSTGDLNLDNTSIASGQTVTINTFTLTDGNPSP